MDAVTSNVPTQNLNPYYVAGFVDAEGCFSIKFVKNNKMKFGWSIYLSFELHLHRKDRKLLENIRKIFGEVGTIYNGSNQSYLYCVASLPEIINTVIPFFVLRSQQEISFIISKKCRLWTF